MVSLLFDENLSYRLVGRLAGEFPGSVHVRTLGMLGCKDAQVWERAAAERWVLVTKDDDFEQLSFLRGAPPKVIWLLVGNAGTQRIAQLLKQHRDLIAEFVAHPSEALLALRLRLGD